MFVLSCGCLAIVSSCVRVCLRLSWSGLVLVFVFVFVSVSALVSVCLVLKLFYLLLLVLSCGCLVTVFVLVGLFDDGHAIFGQRGLQACEGYFDLSSSSYLLLSSSFVSCLISSSHDLSFALISFVCTVWNVETDCSRCKLILPCPDLYTLTHPYPCPVGSPCGAPFHP